jgi:tRNA threonylcarbamoyladenosine biosynthesis protein TsaB
MITGLTLSLDGSTYAGSVALIDGNQVVSALELPDVAKPGRSGRDEAFMPMVAECLRDGKAAPRDIARVICGEGPGSFTSLRIAASIAKGIAVGAGIPLFSVSSLALIVACGELSPGKWMAVLPAMRGESFISIIDVSESGAITELEAPSIMNDDVLEKEARSRGARLTGPAIPPGARPHARGAARMLEPIVAAGARDVESWEPVYGRLAEAQVRWEQAHGRPLNAAG